MGAAGKAHNHDSAAGRLLMLMEVAFCGLFLFTPSSTRKVVNLRQKDFLLWLMVAGALWFLVYGNFDIFCGCV